MSSVHRSKLSRLFKDLVELSVLLMYLSTDPYKSINRSTIIIAKHFYFAVAMATGKSSSKLYIADLFHLIIVFSLPIKSTLFCISS